MLKRRRGEIATLLTLGLVILGGILAIGSSVFLNKNKQTTSTKAAGVCDTSTIGQCFSGQGRCLTSGCGGGPSPCFIDDEPTCPTSTATTTPATQLNPPISGNNQGNGCGSGGLNYQFGSCYQGRRCVQCQHGGKWLTYNCFENDKTCPSDDQVFCPSGWPQTQCANGGHKCCNGTKCLPGNVETGEPKIQEELCTEPPATSPLAAVPPAVPAVAVPAAPSDICSGGNVCPRGYGKEGADYCYKTIDGITYYYGHGFDDNKFCGGSVCSGSSPTNITYVCGSPPTSTSATGATSPLAAVPPAVPTAPPPTKKSFCPNPRIPNFPTGIFEVGLYNENGAGRSIDLASYINSAINASVRVPLASAKDLDEVKSALINGIVVAYFNAGGAVLTKIGESIDTSGLNFITINFITIDSSRFGIKLPFLINIRGPIGIVNIGTKIEGIGYTALNEITTRFVNSVINTICP